MALIINERHTIWSQKMDNRLYQNEQDIRRSHKVYRENHEKLKYGTDKGKSLPEVKIQKGIFQVDYISLLQFVNAMMIVNYIYRKCTGGYKLHKSQEKN